MLGPGRVDPGGHLAEAVVVVPAVQVAHRDPAAADLLGDEVHGEELAQVAQVDRAGRARARGAGDQPVGPAARAGSRRRRRGSPSRWGPAGCPDRRAARWPGRRRLVRLVPWVLLLLAAGEGGPGRDRAPPRYRSAAGRPRRGRGEGHRRRPLWRLRCPSRASRFRRPHPPMWVAVDVGAPPGGLPEDGVVGALRRHRPTVRYLPAGSREPLSLTCQSWPVPVLPTPCSGRSASAPSRTASTGAPSPCPAATWSRSPAPASSPPTRSWPRSPSRSGSAWCATRTSGSSCSTRPRRWPRCSTRRPRRPTATGAGSRGSRSPCSTCTAPGPARRPGRSRASGRSTARSAPAASRCRCSPR